MTTKSKYVDWGGLTPIVNGIRVNATKPGQLGTELTATEVLYLDGLTAGTGAASKAVVLDTNGDSTIPGRLTGGFAREVQADGLAVTLTDDMSGSLCIFDKLDGATFTLPAPAVGLFFDFVVTTASTSVGDKVITDAGTTFIVGATVQITAADAANVIDVANGTTHIAVLMNGTTTGGVPGTKFRLTCISATQWQVEGLIVASGSVATSFSAS